LAARTAWCTSTAGGPRFENVPLPAGSNFWVFNTHTKHALVDGLYAERHRECMEAARGIGVELLVDATPAALAAAEPHLSRAAYKRARHVIDEIGRVEQATAALRAGDLAGVGRLLFASHRSSRTWFDNSRAELDFLVDCLESEKGVYGARLTGGGSGAPSWPSRRTDSGPRGAPRGGGLSGQVWFQARRDPRPHRRRASLVKEGR